MLWPLLGSITVIGLLFIGVFPTRTWLAQRRAMARAEQQLTVLAAENEELEARVAALDTDAEIERLAREEYNLVRPGEEAYAILAPPPPPLSVPRVWPFSALAEKLDPSTPAAPDG
ncbi:MAG: FtsB family cell division protein [Acidimicrobiales bacterium]